MAGNEINMVQLRQGAEAKIYRTVFLGRQAIVKERFSKKYRHRCLDETLCRERTRMECRAITRCRAAGIRTPAVYFVDVSTFSIYMEYIESSITVKEYIQQMTTSSTEQSTIVIHPILEKIGRTVGRLHDAGIIHGDLTTSNMLLNLPYETSEITLIDFGLSYVDASAEDKAVDLYVLERAYSSTHPAPSSHSTPNGDIFERFILEQYLKHTKKAADVLRKLQEVRLRGRKRTMVG